MYLYSVASLFVYVWGIRATSAVSAHPPEIVGHAFPTTRELPFIRSRTRRVSLSIFDEERSGLHNATRGSSFEIITSKDPFKYSQGILQEDPDRTLIMAHIYFMDHVMSTLWTVFFGVAWWSFTAHDGKRITNSPAQEEVATGGASYGHHPPILSETQRAEAALELWNEERNSAAVIIFAGWCIKVGLLLPISPSPQDFGIYLSHFPRDSQNRPEKNLLIINHRTVHRSTS